MIHYLLDEKRAEPIAITAALRGAGGYGKTTLARALCHDERVQEAFDDGILWVTLGEQPGNLVNKVEDLIYALNHEKPGYASLDAASARLVELLADRDILLVVDDAWNSIHLKPFLQGGKRCARLITTRDERAIPQQAQRIQVDAMRIGEAVQDLLSPAERAHYQELAIFPEDVDIPLQTLQRLWGITEELDEFDTEELCIRFHTLSLLLRYDPVARTVRLHDVIRACLLHLFAPGELAQLHQRFLDAYGSKRWADLPADEPYLWDHLAMHLIEAGLPTELWTT